MKFGLYRIIGNDLDGRHGATQSLDNVRYILENEVQFADCEKIWILNRIRNEDKSESLKQEIRAAGQSFLEIKFDMKEYRKKFFTPQELPLSNDFGLNELASTDSRLNCIAHIACISSKALYVINNNGGRNFALRHGKQNFDWTLPFDGNCFIKEDAFEILRNFVINNRYAKYIYVPMHRVTDNKVVESVSLSDANDEPQVCFRSDSMEEFNEDIMYGFKPKVELLKRLDVPGPWDGWGLYYPWSNLKYTKSKESHTTFRASYTVRLADGQQSKEIDQHHIALTREESIYHEVRNIDTSFFINRSDSDSFNQADCIKNLIIKEDLKQLFDNVDLLETAKLNAFKGDNSKHFFQNCDSFFLLNVRASNMDLMDYSEKIIRKSSEELSNFGFFVSGFYTILSATCKSENQPLNLNLFYGRYCADVKKYALKFNSTLVIDDSKYSLGTQNWIINVLEISVVYMISAKPKDAYDILISAISAINQWFRFQFQCFDASTKISRKKIIEISYVAVVIANYFEIVRAQTGINLWEWEVDNANLLKRYSIFICKHYESDGDVCDYYTYLLYIAVASHSAYVKNNFKPLITRKAILESMLSRYFVIPVSISK